MQWPSLSAKNAFQACSVDAGSPDCIRSCMLCFLCTCLWEHHPSRRGPAIAYCEAQQPLHTAYLFLLKNFSPFYLKTSPATSYPESVLLHHGSIFKYQRLIHRLHMPWADNMDGYGDKQVGGVYCVDPLDQRILISQGRIPKWLPWDLSGYSRWTIFMPVISLNWDATVPTYPVSTEASNTPARVCGHLQNPCCLLLAAVWSSWQVEVAGSWTEWVHVIVE